MVRRFKNIHITSLKMSHFFRFFVPTLSRTLSVALSHSATLSVSSSPASSFVLVFSLLLSNSPFSCFHCHSQPLRSRALTLVLSLSCSHSRALTFGLFTVSLSSEKVSLRCEGLRTVQVSALCVLAKGWFFISFMFEKHVKVAVLSDC